MQYQTIGGNNKLDVILKDKVAELGVLKLKVSFDILLKQAEQLKRSDIRDFKAALIKSKHIKLIAEIKKASPSLGDINTEVSVSNQALTYEKAGANAISVLTDAHFKGELSFLVKVRSVTSIPVLRKDFICDPYQVYESYLAGADAILLIATILDLETLRDLISLTHALGMECLVETHTMEDMEKALRTNAQIIGINARNLKTFEVNLENITELAKSVPADKILVAESGINSRDDVQKLADAGCSVILVGTTLMQASSVEEKIHELRSVLSTSL